MSTTLQYSLSLKTLLLVMMEKFLQLSKDGGFLRNVLFMVVFITTIKPSAGKICRNIPKIDKTLWNRYDQEFFGTIHPSWRLFCKGEVSVTQFATDYNTQLASFLESKPEFQEEVKQFFKHNPPSEKTLKEAKKLKNELRKKARKKDATEEDKAKANQALRTYNYILKIQKQKDDLAKERKQEKAYRKNFYKTAKDIANGTFGQPTVSPNFDINIANNFYTKKYSEPVVIDPSKLNWFPNVNVPLHPYNQSPYKPRDIKEALSKKCSSSAPGHDDIVYGFLVHMTYTHNILATIFTRIRQVAIAPDIWGCSKIILIHKGGDAKDPREFRMISLTLNIAKLFHTLEANRTMRFMIDNGYMDPTAQKAFIEGVNGCVEHIEVVHEVIQHARLNKKTAHITWFDLEDAFGSVSHDLIPIVLRYYNIPENIIEYIVDLYSKLQGKVITKEWETEMFEFKKGVFQGDPYSCVIFLIVFNPIIQYIKKNCDKCGYELKTENNLKKHINTTPFADDFNLISKNKKQHQKMISDIELKIRSMGLVIKPSKCSSLSIQSGKSTNLNFHLLNEAGEKISISSVADKPLKFLGSQITSLNKPQDMFQFLFDKLEKKLMNIDESNLRGEYKLNIYSRYALPSLRYHFSVHNIHKTHLEKLDSLAKKFLKKWLNIPTRGATDIALFHPYLLNIKTPSHLYKEGHAGNYALMRVKGDSSVNLALDSRLEREQQWTNKSSTISESHELFSANIENDRFFVPTTSNTFDIEVSRSLEIPKAKAATKKSIKEEITNLWNEKVYSLTMQGEFAKLLIEEKENVTWQSVIKNVPRGIMSFALKSVTNSLATPDNLKRWGKRQLSMCPLCNNNGTLHHILNFCPVALNQGRYTWRHNSVLYHISKTILTEKPDTLEILADLPGLNMNGGTIPPDIITTQLKPDLVILSRSEKSIFLLELTCSFETNIEAANIRKMTRYSALKSDLEDKGWKCHLIPFEVGSRGYISRSNKLNLMNTFLSNRLKPNVFKCVRDMSKISLLCSFSIFHAYTQPTWTDPPFLES